MMMFTNFNPALTFAPDKSAALFDTWSGVAGLYENAMKASMQQWVMSSANIIQEHTLRAFMEASKSCADALAKNAVSMQQKSMERFVDANQKAVGMVGKAFTEAWMGSVRPAA